MNHEHERHGSRRSVSTYVFIGFALIAGYFLVTEHKAHLYGWLSAYGIWLLLLACPLLHLFHGHGGHGGGADKRDGLQKPSGDDRTDADRHPH